VGKTFPGRTKKKRRNEVRPRLPRGEHTLLNSGLGKQKKKHGKRCNQKRFRIAKEHLLNVSERAGEGSAEGRKNKGNKRGAGGG